MSIHAYYFSNELLTNINSEKLDFDINVRHDKPTASFQTFVQSYDMSEHTLAPNTLTTLSTLHQADDLQEDEIQQSQALDYAENALREMQDLDHDDHTLALENEKYANGTDDINSFFIMSSDFTGTATNTENGTCLHSSNEKLLTSLISHNALDNDGETDACCDEELQCFPPNNQHLMDDVKIKT